MLFKRKKDRSFSKQEFNESITIPKYAPNLGLQPKEFEMTEMFRTFVDGFDGSCIDFLKNTDSDEFNGSYIDAMIQKAGAEIIVSLGLQREDHKNLIISTLKKTSQGDLEKCNGKIGQLEQEKTEVLSEIAEIIRILNKGTSFEKLESEVLS